MMTKRFLDDVERLNQLAAVQYPDDFNHEEYGAYLDNLDKSLADETPDADLDEQIANLEYEWRTRVARDERDEWAITARKERPRVS